jgi:hypothetical protein
MVTSMNGVLKMSDPKTSEATPNATSLQEFQDGRMPCDWLVGKTADPSGPAVAPVNLSARQALDAGLMTKGTYGQPSDGSSTSADLQQSLESRLRARLDVNGSPEYVLTWKHWDMESGPPICALRASARRTSGNDCGGLQTGWPTPKAQRPEQATTYAGGNPTLGMAARYAGWPTTTTTRDAASSGSANYSTASGRHSGTTLTDAARFAGWPTARANDGTGGKVPPGRQGGMALKTAALMAGWATPAARDFKSESATPAFNDKRNAEVRGKPLSYQATLGETSSGSPAPTAKRGALNPALSAWLQGYPSDWLMVAPERTPRGRKS